MSRILLLACLLLATPAHASGFKISGAGLDLSHMFDDVSRHTDLGLEVAMVGSGTTTSLDAAIEIDLVLAYFHEDRELVQAPGAPPPPPPRRLRYRILDRVLDGPRPRTAEQKETYRWPFLARPKWEAHIGFLFSTIESRQQVRLGFGTGIGAFGLGASLAFEANEHDGDGIAIGPELRFRHRFGPRLRSPSVGMFVRADTFVTGRDTHDERLSLGLFGMFDVF